MNIERTMEFILKQQARFESNQATFESNQARFESNQATFESNQARFESNQATIDSNFAKAEQRFLRAEKRLDRLERVVGQTTRVVGQLASASLRFRNEIRRSQIEANRQLKALRERSHETEDKLNALIDVVDKSIRRNGERDAQ